MKRTASDTGGMPSFLSLALPLIVQKLITSAFSSVDVLMVGQLGEDVLSGISIGGQLLWILNRLFSGLSAGGLVFMTQYRGSGKNKAIRDCFFKMTLLMSCAAAVFALAGGLFPGGIVGLFTREETIAEIAVPYLRISALSYLPLALSSACTMLLLACGRTGISMLAGTVSAGLHILGNQILIFGGRLPGGEGAAAAALLASAGSLLVQLPFVYRLLSAGRDSGKEADAASVPVSSYLRISALLIAHEGIWGAGIFTYNLMFSNLDSGFYAAVVMFRTVSDVFFSVIGGMASAGGILMGMLVGRGDRAEARTWGRKIVLLDFLTGLILGAVLLVFAAPIAAVFDLSANMTPTVRGTAVLLIRMLGLQIAFKAVPHTFIESVFRAAGDPQAGLSFDTAASWVFTIPLCALTAFALRTDIFFVFLIMIFNEELLKTVFCILHFRRGTWYRPVDGMSATEKRNA